MPTQIPDIVIMAPKRGRGGATATPRGGGGGGGGGDTSGWASRSQSPYIPDPYPTSSATPSGYGVNYGDAPPRGGHQTQATPRGGHGTPRGGLRDAPPLGQNLPRSSSASGPVRGGIRPGLSRPLSGSAAARSSPPDAVTTPALSIGRRPDNARNQQIVVKDSNNGATPIKRSRDSVSCEPKKRIKRDYTEIITVVVGGSTPDEQSSEFKVHKDLICSKSPFFAAACNKEWVQGQTGRVALPTQKPNYFKYYVNWVYSDWIDMDELLDDPSPCPHISKLDGTSNMVKGLAAFDTLCHLSILADFLGDGPCKTSCMEHLVSLDDGKGRLYLCLATVEFVGEHAAPDCGLFKWMIDNIARASCHIDRDRQSVKKRLSRFPIVVKDALLDKAFFKLRSGKPMYDEESSYYDKDVKKDEKKDDMKDEKMDDKLDEKMDDKLDEKMDEKMDEKLDEKVDEKVGEDK